MSNDVKSRRIIEKKKRPAQVIRIPGWQREVKVGRRSVERAENKRWRDLEGEVRWMGIDDELNEKKRVYTE